MGKETKKLIMRPYARLLSMLGDQLIKNEMVALTEIIKNSYDADAKRVRIIFKDFDENGHNRIDSRIIVLDDGCGMTRETIEKHWLNPATPNKKLAKKKDSRSAGGRIVQGEKGIGRFAVFKLGKRVLVTSRRGDFIGSSQRQYNYESQVSYDFSKFDDDFLDEKEEALYLDDLSVDLTIGRPPILFSGSPSSPLSHYDFITSHGTCIEIGSLRGDWSRTKMENVLLQVSKMRPIFETADKQDFSVEFFLNNPQTTLYNKWNTDQLLQLLDTKSVLRVRNGRFDQERRMFNFELNDKTISLSLDDAEIQGLSIFKEYVRSRGDFSGESDWNSIFPQGSFKFRFDIFDLSRNAPSRYLLDNDERSIVRSHRVYLYRDGIRVMPYGDSDDDWLSIDTLRGTKRASSIFSNDQIVGCVDISQKDNPQLRDKTNREGLIEEGDSVRAFITLIQTILSWLRAHPYQQYNLTIQNQKNALHARDRLTDEVFSELEQATVDNKKAKALISKLKRSHDKEIAVLSSRISRTENLAAVGLSVETASHDLMKLLGRAIDNLDGLVSEVEKINDDKLKVITNGLFAVRGQLSMVHSQMRDIQLIFPSTKTRAKLIDLETYIQKVYSIYKRALDKHRINVTIEQIGNPIRAKTTEAVLLQVIINLFDNSMYWLQYRDDPRKIAIILDGDSQCLFFSDNGPGVSEDDAPFIFDAFYSGKGEEGRGLGLYIARQLLARYGYAIRLCEKQDLRPLEGASFIVEFVSQDWSNDV